LLIDVVLLTGVEFSCPLDPETHSQVPPAGQLNFVGREKWHYAISKKLPDDRPSSWRIKVVSCGGGCMGVIGTRYIPSSSCSVKNLRSVVWGNSGVLTYVKGAEVTSTDGWNGCKTGDVLTFTNNPSTTTITLHNSRTNKSHTLSTSGLPNVRLHICMWESMLLEIVML
jgi:hypothetical protein